MVSSIRHLGRVIAVVAGLSISLGWTGVSPTATEAAGAAALPAWHGGIDLYRDGTFTTQKTWLWCTAADVQIIRNIVRRQHDHSTSGQERYYDWMRAHNHYVLPQSAGVDPQGWTAGLRHFVDDRYRLIASKSFSSALKSAVTNLRRTNLPVGVTVSHGGHAWVLTGFTATADPLTTTSFTVTSVRVVGPLFGLQSKNGYDMPPDTKLTTAEFKQFFTPWKYDPMPMIWDGGYVSVQPIPKRAATVASQSPTPAAPAPTPTPRSTGAPPPTATPTVSASPSPVMMALASVAPPTSAGAWSDSLAPTAGDLAPVAALVLVVSLAGVVMAVAIALGLGRAGRRGG
ncbi:MAG TPA: hypothetical protein VGQ64_00220 [Candidatus Limnocylindrales bacterium]|jgi:hypothetical protein|nr:hypothetical protein [Candidatus Limnocylindrales bacterium]